MAPPGRFPDGRPPSMLAKVLTVGASIAFIAAFTLFDPPDWLPWIPAPVVETLGFRPLEMLLNVALFVPLGVSLGWWWPTRPLVIGAAVAVSVTVELLQLGMPDRVSDPVDVLTNSIGAVLGFAVAAVVRARRRGDRTPGGGGSVR